MRRSGETFSAVAMVLLCWIAASTIRAQTLEIAIPDTSAPYAGPVLIPVFIGPSTGRGVVAVELAVAYRSAIVTAVGAELIDCMVETGWSVEDNVIPGTGRADTVLVAMSTALDTLSGRGILVHLFLETADIRHPAGTPLRLRALFNDGVPVAVAISGFLKLTGNDGRFSARPDSIFPGQPLRFTVEDIDADLHPARIDTVRVRAIDRQTGDARDVALSETGTTTGVFKGRLSTRRDTAGTVPFDGVLGVAPGDTIRAGYVDSLTSEGVTDTLSIAVPVRHGTAIGIDRYALLALHSMHLKTRSEVKSGFAGVLDFGDPPFQSGGVELDIGPHAVTAESTIVSAPRVRVGAHARVAGTLVHTDLVSVGPGALIGLPIQVGPDYWPLAGLPEFLTGAPGAENILVRTRRTREIHDGAYNEVRVQARGTLIFTGGAYHLHSLKIGPRGTAVFLAPSVLLIRDTFDLDSRGLFGPVEHSGTDASDIRVYVEGVNGRPGHLHGDPKAATIGVDAVCHANLFAPNGTVSLREKSASTGSFIGRDIILGVNARVRLQSGWPESDFESPPLPLPPPGSVPLTTILGDFNGDGQVNLTDFLLFARAFGHTADPNFDLNGDEEIDMQDFLVFVESFTGLNPNGGNGDD